MRVLAVAALLILPLSVPLQADVLIDNINGLTLDKNGEVERFDALLVGDDGRIEQVYKRRDKRPGKVDYRLDGKGHTLIPGLIDAHADVMGLGLGLLQAQAGFTGTPLGEPRPEDRDLALAEAQQVLLAHGITTVTDMGTTIEEWQTYRRAGDLGSLRIRIVAYADGTGNMALIGGPGPTPWLYGDRLKLNGVTITLDGSLASREAWLDDPYADAPETRGEARMSETRLKNLMSRAAIDNFQVAVTARGDAASGAVLDAIDELAETYTGDRRWRIEHAEVIAPANLPRLDRFDIVVSMQPLAALSDVSTTEQRLGAARLAGVYAWRSIVDAGAVLAFGSGGAAERLAPFAGMAAAITRQDGKPEQFGGWQPQERLTREEALAAYTTGAAHALLAEGRLGRIAEGQRADFLLIAHDPLLATPGELRSMQVLQTWVNGELVYEAAESPLKRP